MRYRSLIISAPVALLLSLLLPVTAQADQECPEKGSGVPAKENAPLFDVPAPYSPGIPYLLGPATLPTGLVKKLLVNYNRLGTPAMEPKAFLDKYYKLNDDKKSGNWDWPKNFGFDGEPKPFTMKKGRLFDRFGDPDEAQFLANERGTPFAARGLPPSSLNTRKDQPEANYHVYCVLKDLTVQSGKIKEFAGQKGGGTQYFLGNTRVQDLISAGQLREVLPKFGLEGL